jgi:hypothetical protein
MKKYYFDTMKWSTIVRVFVVFLAMSVMIQIAFSTGTAAAAQKKNNKKSKLIDHDKTIFPLEGKHRTAECGECHLNGVIQGTPTECEACHWQRKQDDRYRLQLGLHCGDCHTFFEWKVIKPGSWQHQQVTGYALQGAHKTIDCFLCHKGDTFVAQPSDCWDCHQKDYREADEPDHVGGNFPRDCSVCHSGMQSWEGAAFSHTIFPLRGQHQTAACTECHNKGQYSGISRDCSGCHLDDFNQTTNPNHQQAGYGTGCESCHGSEAVTWTGATTGHTRFPLNGRHAAADCTACHTGGQYTGISQECISCHRDDYNSTRDPNHQQAGFSTDCVPCHGTEAVTWDNANFNHNQFWRLQGAHRSLDCNTCHRAGYDLPTNCYGCHRQDYENTSDPNHVSAGFPTSCESCHFSNHVSWNQARFNHRFPIDSGKHARISCSECHLTGNYAMFSCIDCHEHDRNETDKDHDDVGGYQYNSQACYSCHPRGTEDD